MSPEDIEAIDRWWIARGIPSIAELFADPGWIGPDEAREHLRDKDPGECQVLRVLNADLVRTETGAPESIDAPVGPSLPVGGTTAGQLSEALV